jgi:multidrug resistance efflux pump
MLLRVWSRVTVRNKTGIEAQIDDLKAEVDSLHKRRKLDLDDFKQQEQRYNTLIKVGVRVAFAI